MKLIFHQTENDLFVLINESLASRKTVRYLGYFLIAIFGINLISDIVLHGFTIRGLMSWAVPILVFLLIRYVWKQWAIKNAMNSSRGGMAFVGEKELEITDDELLFRGSNYSTSFQWSALTNISEDDQFYIIKSGRAVIICVRKTSIENRDIETDFFNRLRTKIIH